MLRRPVSGAGSPPLYARFLTFLLAMSVAILIIPVTLQIISRYTALIPVLHLDRGDGALPVHLDGADRRHGGRARKQPLRGRCLADPVAARRGGRAHHGAARHPGARPGVRVGGHGIHALRLVPHLRAGRPAALDDPHRLAGRRRHLDRLPGRAVLRRGATSCWAGARHERLAVLRRRGGRDPVRRLLLPAGAARAGRHGARPRLPAARLPRAPAAAR